MSASARIEPRGGRWLAILVPVVLGILLHGRPLRALLYWDDDRFFVNWAAPDTLGACLVSAFEHPRFDSYHPLHVALVCVERIAFGADLVAIHVVSVLLAATLLALLTGWMLREGVPWKVAWIPAAFVAAHPLMAETFVSPASQKDLLGLVFSVALLWTLPVRRQPRRIALAVLFTILAGWSKSGYAMVGALPLLYAWAHRERPSPAVAAPFVVGAVTLGFAVVIVRDVGLPNTEAAWLSPLLLLKTFGHYARAVVWPDEVGAYRCLGPPALEIASAVVALGVVTWACTRRAPLVRFGLAIAVVGLLPYLNAIPTPFIVSGRYVPLLLAGVGVALAGAASRARRWVLAAPVAIGVFAFVGAEARSMWRDDLRLWRTTYEEATCDELPAVNLSSAYVRAGDWNQAEATLVDAMKRDPSRAKTYADWALLLAVRGDCAAPVPEVRAPKLVAELARSSKPARTAYEQGWWATALVFSNAPGKEPLDPARARIARMRLGACDARRAALIDRAFE